MSIMKSIEINSLRDVFGFISTYKIAGIIPLDIIAHLLVGFLIMVFLLRKLNLKYHWSLLVVLIISLLKEYYDSLGPGRTMDEHLKDVLFTLVFPFIIGFIRFIKWAKIESETNADSD